MAGDPTRARPFGTAREPTPTPHWTITASPPHLVGQTEADAGYRRPKEGEKGRVAKTKANTAEDLLSGDKPVHVDLQLFDLFRAPDVTLADQVTNLFNAVSWGTMNKVAQQLLGRFLASGAVFAGGASAEHFKSTALNNEILGTGTFLAFDVAFQRRFDKHLRLAKFDPYRMAVIAMDDLDFSTIWQQATGLGITIHQVHAVEARISNFVYDRTAGTWDCRFHYTLYDHFGLDYQDIVSVYRKFRVVPTFWNGFLAWYVLQHYRGFKPFIVEASIVRPKRLASTVGKPAS